MTKRITTSVARGKIDNTVEGRTLGQLWLEGIRKPIALDLNGNCWRDLAGRSFRFTNPNPLPTENLLLDPRQRGIIGDVTARLEAPPMESPPANSPSAGPAGKDRIYLEWFSETDGRVLIDATGFELVTGNPVWELDEEFEGAQQLANAHAFRDYLRHQGITHEPPPGHSESSEDSAHQPSSRNTRPPDALYREVAAKYRDHPNARSLIAFVMGWDDMLASYGEDSEDATTADNDPNSDSWHATAETAPPSHFPDESEPHPVQQEAEALAMRALHVVGAYPDPEGETEETVGTLIHSLGEIASKLARVFPRRSDKARKSAAARDALERCLKCQEEALVACSELLARADDDPHHGQDLETLREEILELRDTLTAFQRKFKKP